ncbi:hypothetical protein SpCBS45565_g02615 [Spizellomyces sp. 'palustris']|nr:hypothetical protein SpCBS45565_g02615 [Spizellomyces sp. 'palustris']
MADGLPYTRRVRFMQIQLEQDSGKSVLGVKDRQTLVDLNRAGVGVLELITEPDLRSSLETVTFLKKLQRLLWYTSISSPDMDEGAWRCDINVSVRPLGAPYGTRTEIKHLVKFTSIKSAIEYEIDRQVQLLELGHAVQQETRSFDQRLAKTVRLRGKEGVQDYRYMPEPDLPSIHLTPAFISKISKTLPEPLDTRRTRLATQYNLVPYQIEILLSEPGAVEYFENVAIGRRGGKVANWIIGDLFGSLRSRHLNLLSCTVEPTRLGHLIDLVETGRVSGLRAKDILHAMMDGNTQSPLEIAESFGWILASDVTALHRLCEEIVDEFPEMAVKVRNGKTRVIKFFVGEVMKRTRGKSDPVLVAEIYKKLFNV